MQQTFTCNVNTKEQQAQLLQRMGTGGLDVVNISFDGETVTARPTFWGVPDPEKGGNATLIHAELGERSAADYICPWFVRDMPTDKANAAATALNTRNIAAGLTPPPCNCNTPGCVGTLYGLGHVAEREKVAA